MFGNVFLTGFPCPGGRGLEEEQPRGRLRLVHQSEISKYLSCDPHLSVHWCSFLGQKHYVSGKIHEYTGVYPMLPTEIYPELSGFTITHINCGVCVSLKNH